MPTDMTNNILLSTIFWKDKFLEKKTVVTLCNLVNAQNCLLLFGVEQQIHDYSWKLNIPCKI